MAQAKPSVRSYGELARMALSHPGWSDDGAKPQPRSLAALCSKLDRGVELEWLADRPAVQSVFADVLGASPSAIAELLGTAIQSADDATQQIRLRDVPYARPIDLLRERLPPGIPEIVSRPPQWQRLWWSAPSGAGRTISGRWLAARGLATYVEADTWDEACRSLPATGAAFVELRRAVSATAPMIVPVLDQLCVAAPYCPDESTLFATSWTKIISPPPSDYVAELLAWIEPRLSADGQFHFERALAWLKTLIARETFHTFGALLGLIGVFDEFGAKRVETSKVEDLAQRYLEARFASSGDPAEMWLRREGFKAVVGMARTCLTDSEEPADAPRAVEQWALLIPQEFQRNVDADWIRLSVSKASNPVTKKELDRALKDLPPGGFRIVRTLEKAGLFIPSSDGKTLGFGPRWLVDVLIDRARRDIVAGSGFEWGEALLQRHATRAIFACVRRRFERGGLVDDVLDFDEDENPASAAALEATFRGAGLALLEGADLPVEYLESVWDAQLDLVIQLGELPFPRILYPDDSVSADLRVGAWCLAALAISEQLPAHRGRRHLLLRPWLLLKPAPALVAVLDAVHAVVVEANGAEPWALAAYALMARLDETLGAEAIPHAMNAPARLLSAAATGDLRFELAQSLDAHAWCALPALCQARHLDETDIWRALWLAWSASVWPETAFFDPTLPAAPSVWRAAPADILAQAIVGGAFRSVDVPYSILDDEQCTAVLDAMSSTGMSEQAFWSTAPESAIHDALASRKVHEEAAHVLWFRAPGAVLQAVDREMEKDPAWAQTALVAAPPSLTAEVVHRLRRLSSTGLLEPEWVRPWLHARVSERSPGWRDAYRLLAQLLATKRVRGSDAGVARD